eukprot:UN17869
MDIAGLPTRSINLIKSRANRVPKLLGHDNSLTGSNCVSKSIEKEAKVPPCFLLSTKDGSSRGLPVSSSGLGKRKIQQLRPKMRPT